MLIEVGQELDRLRQHDPVTKRDPGHEEHRCKEDKAEHHTLGMLLDRGSEEAPELPQDDG